MTFPVSKVNASALSTTVENTAALVNTQLDFSLLKVVQAPPEFQALGAALSPQRRKDAEGGTFHQTARRLSALFEQILPSTPNLQKAYGCRASEISRNTKFNQTGSKKDGVFAEHVGADGTSIWAAATSGAPAVAVHLLACMLARLFSSSEAISIWFEIVQVRKKAILTGFEDGLMSSLAAVDSEVSRHELARWDTSARAWLQTADDVQLFAQKQLMLILDNITLPVNLDNSTYDNVVGAWISAMKMMERLIEGQPQRVATAAVLLGLQSWHLFPDLIVLDAKPTTIMFNDKQISPAGRLTVGLESRGDTSEDGIYWSLALSHLRFYGDPVVVSRNLSHNSSRLTIKEVHLLALGSVLASWGEHGLNEIATAHCLIALWDCIQRVPPRRKTQDDYSNLMASNNWFHMLVEASKAIVGPQNVDREAAVRIVRLGRRRGKNFLVEGQNDPPPLFGLSHASIATILENPDTYGNTKELTKVAFMQMIARALKLQPEECFIRVRRPGSLETFEYTTCFPHSLCLPKPAYRTWTERVHPPPEPISHCSCLNSCLLECPCLLKGCICMLECHPAFTDCQNSVQGTVVQNIVPGHFIEQRLEGALGAKWKENVSRATKDGRMIPNFLLKVRRAMPQLAEPATNSSSIYPSSLCECFSETERHGQPIFDVVAGEVSDVALFVQVHPNTTGVRQRRSGILQALNIASNTSWVSLGRMTDILTCQKTKSELVLQILGQVNSQQSVTLPRFGNEIFICTYTFKEFLRSLHALCIATGVYDKLTGASISKDIISRPLYRSRWIPMQKGVRSLILTGYSMSSENVFACTAMFESGSYDLQPEELRNVMAISARNSLYVSKTMLSDPYDENDNLKVALVLGNVGCKGLALLVSPPTLQIRSPNLDQWDQINHDTFDGQREDAFASTSLHLSFTNYQLPLGTGNQGCIDNDLAVLEAVIQVYDHGKWIGDIDPVSLHFGGNLFRHHPYPHCGHAIMDLGDRRLTSLTTWDELLDPPEDLVRGNIGVVKAHKNWLGRLATACICIQRGYRTILVPHEGVCWRCCYRLEPPWTAASVDKTLFSLAPENNRVRDMIASNPSWRTSPEDTEGIPPSLADDHLPGITALKSDESDHSKPAADIPGSPRNQSLFFTADDGVLDYAPAWTYTGRSRETQIIIA